MSFALALSALSFGYSIYQGMQSNASQAKSKSENFRIQAETWRQQAGQMEAKALDYNTQAESAFEQAEIKRENAGAKLEYGQDVYSQGTDTFNIQRQQMGGAMGQSRAAIGTSSVESTGSMNRLIAENAVQMSRDLNALRETTESQWGQTMAQRKSDILSAFNLETNAENFLESADYYEGLADEYLEDARWAERESMRAQAPDPRKRNNLFTIFSW